MKAVNRLADRLLTMVVPRTTAAAQECYRTSRCVGNRCTTHVNYRYYFLCCPGNNCYLERATCSCYLGGS